MIDPIKYCNLLQACEYIAFGYQPMNKLQSEAKYGTRPTLIPDKCDEANIIPAPSPEQKDYARAIYAARAKLALAIYKKDISILGTNSIQRRMYNLGQDYVKDIDFTRLQSRQSELNQDEIYNIYKNMDLITPIDDIKDTLIVNLIDNTVQTDPESCFELYSDIHVSISDLIKIFPRKSKISEDVSRVMTNNAKQLREKEKNFLQIWQSSPDKILSGKTYERIIDNIQEYADVCESTAKLYYKKYIKSSPMFSQKSKKI